ncbi:hypothetical protein FB451DRAFT_1187817 [Mycena latifolia]|nr:hypothetical protein FB451DRAFT_1187817 [Mycena latifolia]
MAEKRAGIKAKRRRSENARAAQAELERAEQEASIALSQMLRQKTKAWLRELKAARGARRGESPLPPSSAEQSSDEEAVQGKAGAEEDGPDGDEASARLRHIPDMSDRQRHIGVVRRGRPFRLSTPPFSSPPPEELEEKIPSFYDKLWAAVEAGRPTSRQT